MFLVLINAQSEMTFCLELPGFHSIWKDLKLQQTKSALYELKPISDKSWLLTTVLNGYF